MVTYILVSITVALLWGAWRSANETGQSADVRVGASYLAVAGGIFAVLSLASCANGY